ncbi:glycosyltransferase family 2 protein [Phascolarctobacterium sp. ET69]|uniref:glycosyltransferase family 2 protein n=1 Tax=Phascolarctobacterium sp. ET69 TaxID=2939420 RepID=UPI002012344A|nr:glycosyltransferase family 2 protein [Phascolarctobacterium sp. ET69]MCL1604579.1 glycosyltransferase family 2 protein [Phascolarctobacterium sp. ET69]
MYKNKLIGVVILNYKDANTTIKLSNIIKNYNVIDKIVIVDNLSPDDSYYKLSKNKTDKIDVIQTDKNGGYSYGNNFGAFYLVNKYNIDILFIANPDVEFSEQFIIKCSDYIDKKILQAISGIMLLPNGHKSIWNGKINNFYEDVMDCTIFLKHFFKNYTFDYTSVKNELIYVDFLPGSLFAIDSSAFIKIKGFDDKVFLYCEESIISMKLKEFGYRLAICKNISFKHMHSESINKSITKINQLKLLYKSKLYFHKNYLSSTKLQIFILKIFMYYGIFARKILYKFFY